MSDPAAPVRPRTVWAWALYDFANSAFTTLVVTFVYATFFTKSMVLGADGAADETLGSFYWGNAVAVAAILVATLSPILGALADRGGYRKQFLVVSTVVAILTTASLYVFEPGAWLPALALFVVGNVAFEMGAVFYNAYLPEITTPERIGRVSGLGWGLGYIGGLLCLVVALFVFVQVETPPFGLVKELGQNVRATMLLTAGWFALFAIPFFLFVRDDRPAQGTAGEPVVAATFRELKRTFREVRRYSQIVRFLVARLFYNDGLVTIFAMGGTYAAVTFGFSFAEVIQFGIALNLAAGLGALAFGMVDDKLGGKRTILVSIVGLCIATLIATLLTTTASLWTAGILVGLFAGPNQSPSRSLLGRMIPPDKETEFYGFFAFSGKLTAFIGPALFGWFTVLFGTQRAGIGAVLVLFVLGGVLLLRVDEAEGLAQRSSNAVPTP